MNRRQFVFGFLSTPVVAALPALPLVSPGPSVLKIPITNIVLTIDGKEISRPAGFISIPNDILTGDDT